MLTFIIIGLLCNSQGCYWAITNADRTFTDYQQCMAAGAALKNNSVMYHSTACLVKP
jgi:hypothetical protein